MDTTLNPAQTDTRHAVFARVDEELAKFYEQLTRGDEQSVQDQLSKSEHGAARHPPDHPQTRGNTFRPAVPGKRASLGGRAVRGFTGLILTACICVAAIVWQSSYGDAARQIVARWTPRLVATSSLPLENPGFSAQPSPPAVQAAAAKTASPQPASLAPTAAEDVAPTAAAPSPEVTQLLQPMARDLATARQEIEQLKAGQEQLTRDNASIAEQLKASQEQMARLTAKVSEQNLRPKISAPPRLAAAPARKPASTLPSQQDAARPQATTR